jgi:hypothetical protein
MPNVGWVRPPALSMTLGDALTRVWEQAMVEERRSVQLGEQKYPVRKTRGKELRTVQFEYEGLTITGI